jgi:prolyl oligopeptidase
MLTKKQNVFDDFHASMRHLVKAGYTQVSKLAIEGGSNGGLLMGAMIAQHPGDFEATISHVGIYDSVRSELSPNGAFNIPEFGTVENPDHFKALYAYSPYHNLKKTSYPSILFMTGENDGRVDPMHSRKMTAALQFENTSINPILLRTSGNTGHGSGTPLNETITQQVDRLVFLFNSLGMQYKAVPVAAAGH